MKSLHTPHHWLWVAIVLAALLLTLSNVYGQQRSDSSAVFEGRPAMAGAQAGTGAMAGPPQGGIGIQGQDNSQFTLRRRSTGAADMPQGQPATPNTDVIAENRAVRGDQDIIKRNRDSGVAKDQRSVVQKTKRAIKHIAKQTRHGVSDVQTTTQ